jgi:hypothetical protein
LHDTGQHASCSASGTHAARFETFERIVKAADRWAISARNGVISTYRPLG